jgi:hypothetical protein
MSSNGFTQTQINTLATSLPSQGGTFDILTQTSILNNPPSVTSGWTIPQKTTFIELKSDNAIDINNINFEIYPRDITLTLTGASFITSFAFYPPPTSPTLFIPAGTSVPINYIQSSSSTVKFQISGIPIDIKSLELHGFLTYIDVSNLTSLTTLNCKTAFDSAKPFIPIIPNTVTDLNMNYNGFISSQVNALVSALPPRTPSTPSTFHVQYQDSGDHLARIIHTVAVPTYWSVDTLGEATTPTLPGSSNITGSSTETDIVFKITTDPLEFDGIITLTGCVEYFSNSTSFNVYAGEPVFYIKITNNVFTLRFDSIINTTKLKIEHNPLVNSFNNRTSVTIDINNFSNLLEADLSGINLIRFPLFTSTPISKLDVSNNAITRIDNLYGNIEEINAENNRITTIPDIKTGDPYLYLSKFLLYGNPLETIDKTHIPRGTWSLSPFTTGSPDLENAGIIYLTLGNVSSLVPSRINTADFQSANLVFTLPVSCPDLSTLNMDANASVTLNAITDFDSSKFNNNVTSLNLTFSSPPTTALDLINLGTVYDVATSSYIPAPSKVSSLILNNINTASINISKFPDIVTSLMLSYAVPSAMPDLKVAKTNGITKLILKNINVLEPGYLPASISTLQLDSCVLPDLSVISGLETLSLTNCNITTSDMVGFRAKLPSGLISLTLSGNNFTSIPDLSTLSFLTTLNLGYNNISSINPTYIPLTVTTLTLATNKLTAFSLRSGSQVTSLDLRFNSLTSPTIKTFIESLSGTLPAPLGRKTCSIFDQSIGIFKPSATIPSGWFIS